MMGVDFTLSDDQPDLLRQEDRIRAVQYYYKGNVLPPDTYSNLSNAINESQSMFRKDDSLKFFRRVVNTSLLVAMAAVVVISSILSQNEGSAWWYAIATLGTLSFAVFAWFAYHRHTLREKPELRLLSEWDREIAKAATIHHSPTDYSDPEEDVYRDPTNRYGDFYQGSILTAPTLEELRRGVDMDWSPEMDATQFNMDKSYIARSKRILNMAGVAAVVLTWLVLNTGPVGLVAVMAVTALLVTTAKNVLTETIGNIYPVHQFSLPELYLFTYDRTLWNSVRSSYVPDLRARVIAAMMRVDNELYRTKYLLQE